MKINKFVIAAAGSGKTGLLVQEAIKIQNENVLITTFTESNRDEIIKKVLEKRKYVPKNISIQTWFSFLLQHGVRPYQSILNDSLHLKRIGFYLYQGQSARYISESAVIQHYFSDGLKIYSDKISKFVYKCNEKLQNEIVNRISRIYPNIFIDEVQDLAGWDLDLLLLLINSKSKILMVGDPRQAVYDTNDSSKYRNYRGSGIQNFIKEKCKADKCQIDMHTLTVSHRNNKSICIFSSKIYPNYPASASCVCTGCKKITGHDGIFLVRLKDIENYLNKYSPIMQLKLRSDSKNVIQDLPALNFGLSKGLTFDRVLIYPTEDIRSWILDNNHDLAERTRAHFYVGITRARYSVGIVMDYRESMILKDIELYDASN